MLVMLFSDYCIWVQSASEVFASSCIGYDVGGPTLTGDIRVLADRFFFCRPVGAQRVVCSGDSLLNTLNHRWPRSRVDNVMVGLNFAFLAAFS